MDTYRLAVKLFLTDPNAVDPVGVIGLFHRWIQTHRIPGLLIDVCDYDHVPDSPGVGLIGHEADLFLDDSEGPRGLMYVRKHPFEAADEGDQQTRLAAAFRLALTACSRFEEDYKPGAKTGTAAAPVKASGKAQFGGCEALVIFNDRLNAPNDEAGCAAALPTVQALAHKLYGGAKVDVTRVKNDPRKRLTLRIKSSAAAIAPSALLARLG